MPVCYMCLFSIFSDITLWPKLFNKNHCVHIQVISNIRNRVKRSMQVNHQVLKTLTVFCPVHLTNISSIYLSIREPHSTVKNSTVSQLRHRATSCKSAGSISYDVTEYFIGLILPAALWPGSRFNLWQKWVPGKSGWGVKAAGKLGWQSYHLNVPMV
jgi:uncharacterized protein (UPF0333 family)